MRHYLFAATAIAALAMPAAARDHTPYVGIEAGIIIPEDIDFDVAIREADAADSVAGDANEGIGESHFAWFVDGNTARTAGEYRSPGKLHIEALRCRRLKHGVVAFECDVRRNSRVLFEQISGVLHRAAAGVVKKCDRDWGSEAAQYADGFRADAIDLAAGQIETDGITHRPLIERADQRRGREQRQQYVKPASNAVGDDHGL